MYINIYKYVPAALRMMIATFLVLQYSDANTSILAKAKARTWGEPGRLQQKSVHEHAYAHALTIHACTGTAHVQVALCSQAC